MFYVLKQAIVKMLQFFVLTGVWTSF